MKKLFLFISFLLLAFFSQAQRTSNTGPWQVWSGTAATLPANWQNDPNPVAGWVTPTTPVNPPGVAPHITLFAQSELANTFPGTGLQNYVWAPTPIPATWPTNTMTFYRLVFNHDNDDGCAIFRFEGQADDNLTVFINGNQFAGPTTNWRASVDVVVPASFLVCGENVLTVTATQTGAAGGQFFFYGNLINTQTDYDVNIVEQSNCDLQETYLSLNLTQQYQSVTWVGPNDFLSTQENIVVTQSGTYTVTIILGPCCSIVKEIEVNVPENCCDEEIEYTRTDCNHFEFSLTENFVDVDQIVWSLNGVVVSKDDLYVVDLPPGTHEICANYIGTQKNNPDEICCERKCITVMVPTTTYMESTRYICDLEGVNPLYQFDPCTEYPGYAYYTMDGTAGNILFMYDSRTQGCQIHDLPAGNYNFKFYDENDCLILDLTLNILIQAPNIVECDLSTTINCGDNLDLSLFQLCENCPTGNQAWGDWYLVTNNGTQTVNGTFLTNVTESGIYKRELIDPINCTKCVITLDVTVIKHVVLHTIQVTPPDCKTTMDLASLNALLLSIAPQFCTGAYTDLQVVETDNSLIPTGRSFVLSNGTPAEDFNAPFTYTIKPTDPNSCCEVRITVVCSGESPPPFSEEDPYVDVFQAYEYMNENGMFASPATSSSSNTIGLNEIMLKVIPNPSTGKFNILLENVEEGETASIKIFDNHGRLIKQVLNESDNRNAEVDISSSPNGFYHIKAKIGNKTKTKTIVLSK